MPIKPENRHRYPANWKEIREQVLKRAKHCCELCAAPNGEHIARDKSEYQSPAKWICLAPDQYAATRWYQHLYHKPIKVVLTIAHLDPTYSSHDPKHLLALCQRCHNKIDVHLRSTGRKKRTATHA